MDSYRYKILCLKFPDGASSFDASAILKYHYYKMNFNVLAYDVCQGLLHFLKNN